MTFSKARTQLNIHSLCKTHYDSLIITHVKCKEGDTSILEQQKYKKITYLDIEDNKNITSVNHLKYLTYLNCSGSCGVADGGISEIFNVTNLDVSGNKRITNINHLKMLTSLDCGSSEYSDEKDKCTRVSFSGITDNGISQLENITNLFAAGNKKVTSANHLKKLTHLDCSCFKYIDVDINFESYDGDLYETYYSESDDSECGGEYVVYSGITNSGISKLKNIVKLYMENNFLLTNINHLENLTLLDCSYAIISDEGLCDLSNLTDLNMQSNFSIKDINNFKKIKILDCSDTVISDKGLSDLKNITKLDMSGNRSINSIRKFTDLTHLVCKNICNISNKSISKCSKITYLDVSRNKTITDVNSLKELKYLVCKSDSGLGTVGINKLKNIVTLHASDNPTMYDVNHLKNLTYADFSGCCSMGWTGICNLDMNKISIKGLAKIQKTYMAHALKKRISLFSEIMNK